MSCDGSSQKVQKEESAVVVLKYFVLFGEFSKFFPNKMKFQG